MESCYSRRELVIRIEKGYVGRRHRTCEQIECQKALFTSENFHSQFCSFLCFVRNCIILHSQDVVLGHFGKTGVYAGHCFIIHLKLDDVGISSNLIGSLSLTNGQYPPPGGG